MKPLAWLRGLPIWTGWAFSAALLLGAVLLARKLTADKSEALAELEAESQRADSVVALYENEKARSDSLHGLYEATREAWEADTTRLRKRLTALSREETRAAAQVDTATRDLTETLVRMDTVPSPEVKLLVPVARRQWRDVQEAHACQVRLLRAQVDTLGALARALSGRLTSCEATLLADSVALSRADSALRAMTENRDRWREEARPSLWDRLYGSAPEALAKTGVTTLACTKGTALACGTALLMWGVDVAF